MKFENIQQSLDLLPKEIIEEILSLFDVKSLLRFRCISKSYRSLIDSKRFIKTHLQKSKEDSTLAHHRVLLFSYTDPREAKVSVRSLLSFIDNSNHEGVPMNFPTTFPARYSSISSVGCCNGLVCIVLDINKASEQFILWNPSTRISKNLPEIDKNKIGYKYKRYGLGWDESSDDYKVIAIVSVEGLTTCKIYSSKTDSWKKINVCDIDSQWCEPAKLANGKLYWERNDIDVLSNPNEWEIVAFDVKREVFENVERPACYSEDWLWRCLGKFGEWLAVLCWCDNSIYIWVMKEYGVKVSWERVMIIDDDVWTSPSVDAFYNGKDRDLVLLRMVSLYGYTKWLVYDVKRKEFHIKDFWIECDIYIESLVSPLE